MPITYPINNNDRFTVYDENSGAPLKDGRGRPMKNETWGSTDKTQMIPNLAPNIKWLLNVKESKPAFDSATEKLEKVAVNYDVANETATEGWTIVPLSAEEIAAKVRTTSRDQMAADWALLDSELRGLFHSQYMASLDLLDRGEDEAAKFLIDGMDPFEVIKGNPTKLATFNAVKAQFSTAIDSLPGPPV